MNQNVNRVITSKETTYNTIREDINVVSVLDKNFIWNLQKLSTQTILIKARDRNKRICSAFMKPPYVESDFHLVIPPAFFFPDEGFLLQMMTPIFLSYSHLLYAYL